MPSVNQTCLRLKAPSSRIGLAPSCTLSFGRKSQIRTTVSAPMKPTAPKAMRQLRACPNQVATGVPMRVATVRPIMTRATAWVRLLGGTREAATSAATPK